MSICSTEQYVISVIFLVYHIKSQGKNSQFYLYRDIISSELCSAVEMNLQHKVKVLLGLPGININYKKNGKVPLMHIQWRNKPFEDCLQIEELLLAQNPNIDKVDDQGISAR